MVKAFLTGATGFLGKQVFRQLLERGVAVRCLVRASSNVAVLDDVAQTISNARWEFIRGDLERLANKPDLLEGCDVALHLAAEMKGSVAVLFLGNVVAARGLLQAAAAVNLRRFVLVSSIAVHHTATLESGSVVDETCPLDPEPHRRDGYTFSKVVQEQAAWEAHHNHGVPLVVVRPGVIYGPGRDCLTTRVGLRLGNLMVVMNGQRSLPYTFVDNCARAIVQAGLDDHVPVGEAFNVVDDNSPTPRDLLGQYRDTVGNIRSVGVPGWAVLPLSGIWEWYSHWSQGQVPEVLTRYKSSSMWKRLIYSNAKARNILDWQPTIDFPEGLRRTLTWLHTNQRRNGLPLHL